MTHLVVCGLNYHTTPISIRERFAMPESCLQFALQALVALPHVMESVVLSTCNRMEVYAVVSELESGLCELNSFFKSVQAVPDHEALVPNFRLIGEDVALHLFRVACGLDSMIMGEGQILSQIKAAHQAAMKAEASGAVLNYLFNSAANCGKRVRSETPLGKCAVSVSSAAVKLAERHLGRLGKKNVLVIGAGKMGNLCLKELAANHPTVKLTVANRTRRTAAGDASPSPAGTTWRDFDERHEVMSQADVVFVATSAREFVVQFDELQAMRAGSQKELCVVDISVPRNVDPRIEELPGVKLFHADDLRSLVGVHLPHLETLIDEAEAIIFEKLDEFQKWQQALTVVPTICDLHEKLEAIRIQQTQRVRGGKQPAQANATEEQIDRLGKAIIAQILHEPTAQLKAAAQDRSAVESLRLLFNLSASDGVVAPAGGS